MIWNFIVSVIQLLRVHLANSLLYLGRLSAVFYSFFFFFFVFVSLSPSSGSLHFSSSFAPHKKAFIEYKTGNKVTFGSDLALPVGSCWMERLGCARFRKWQMINFVHVFASLLKCFLHVNLPQGQFLFGENMLSIFRCPAITADTLKGYFLQSSVSKL